MLHRNATRAAALALCLFGGAASAQTNENPEQVEAARGFYRAGVQAFQRNRYPEAMVAFERSFRARPHPATLYNAAEARMRAGDTVGALEQLRDALAMSSPAPDEELITRIRNLAQQMGESNITPRRVEAPSCPACPTCPPAPSCPPAAPTTQRVSTSISPAAYALAGASLALVGVGAGFLAVALDNANTYSNAATPRDLQLQLRDQGETYRIVGISGLVLGVGAAVGAVWMFTHPRERVEESPTAARVDFGVGLGGAVISGRF